MNYLGVLIDETLSFNHHMNRLVGMCYTKLKILKRARPFIDSNTSLMLYRSLVLPLIDYGNVCYSITSDDNLHRIQTIQNAALK